MGGNNSNEAGAGLRAVPTSSESETEDAVKKPTRTIDALAPGKMVREFGKARHTTNESGKVTKNKTGAPNEGDESTRPTAGMEGEGGAVDMGAIPLTPVTPAGYNTDSPAFGE